ncbi:hypothetical protein [Streptomyces sp. NPDC001480]|uniref:hypothetical protein n=1 Tax=Streptomyces sp. NPDC001480 TaxID=3364577 RepID=UPI0036874038
MTTDLETRQPFWFTDRDGQSWTRDNDSGNLWQDDNGDAPGWMNVESVFKGLPVNKPVVVCGASGS